MKNTTFAVLTAALFASAFAQAAHAQGARAASPFGTAPQDSQPPADWRPGQRTTTVAPAQTPPNPAIPPNPCTTKVPGATPPNPCTPAASARYAAKVGAKPANSPSLSISPAQPAFAVAQSCRDGAPLVTLRVVVRNTGSTAYKSPAHSLPVTARDDAKVSWTGIAPLPSLAPGASQTISIPVYPPSYLPRAAGTHRFTVSTPWQKTAAPIVVSVPAGACGGLAQRFKSSVVLAKAAPIQTSAAGATRGSPGPSAAQKLRLASKAGNLPLVAPSDVQSTVDPKICTDHGGLGGGLACSALLPQGRLALIWGWSGQAVDGFNVYRVDGGQRARAGRQANGKEATVYIVDPVPAGGYDGKCYAVSAYRGAEESPLSAAFCAGGGSVLQTATITPGQARSMFERVDPDGGGKGDSGRWDAGYSFFADTNILGDSTYNRISRLALYFDTASVAHRKIYSARLKLSVTKTFLDDEGFADHYTSCAARIGKGLDRWWTHGDWIDATEVLRPGRAQGPDVVIDVTAIVRDWAQFPDNNFGLVLMGETEDLGSFTVKTCETTYDPARAQLEVQFQ
jgi:hypothetical protein